MVYHVFNASHDEALACGQDNFTPSAAARRIDSDLAMLPYWYAASGDTVVMPYAAEARAFAETLPVKRNVAIADDFTGAKPSRIEPWGWDKPLVRRLLQQGVPQEVLPSEEYLALVRRLQSRETVSRCLSLMFEKFSCYIENCNDMFAGHSAFVRSVEELHALAVFASGHFIMKKPWSGSGRGLFVQRNTDLRRADVWCAAAIKAQGGVEVQPFLNKVCDCAVEFCVMPDGKAVSKAFSAFETTVGGAYTGNIVKHGIETDICMSLGTSAPALSATVNVLQQVLPAVLNGYCGCVGVDMLVCRDAQRTENQRLFPCVEINLRRTMGMVAAALVPFVAKDSMGKFQIAHERSTDMLRKKCDDMRRRQPLVIHGGRIVSGYMPLTPIGTDTRFHACLMVSASHRMRLVR